MGEELHDDEDGGMPNDTLSSSTEFGTKANRLNDLIDLAERKIAETNCWVTVSLKYKNSSGRLDILLWSRYNGRWGLYFQGGGVNDTQRLRDAKVSVKCEAVYQLPKLVEECAKEGMKLYIELLKAVKFMEEFVEEANASEE